MDLGIPHEYGFGLGPRLGAGLRPKVAPTEAVTLLRTPVFKVWWGMGLEIHLNVQLARVGDPPTEIVL